MAQCIHLPLRAASALDFYKACVPAIRPRIACVSVVIDVIRCVAWELAQGKLGAAVGAEELVICSLNVVNGQVGTALELRVIEREVEALVAA